MRIINLSRTHVYSHLLASFTFRKRSEAKMKLFRRSLVEFMISFFVRPCHSFLPSYIYRIVFSDAHYGIHVVRIDDGGHVEFHGDVVNQLVYHQRCFGVETEFGSSQNRYLGLRAMALAMATRFCIPPLISSGNFFCASSRFTLSRQNWARFTRSA